MRQEVSRGVKYRCEEYRRIECDVANLWSMTTGYIGRTTSNPILHHNFSQDLFNACDPPGRDERKKVFSACSRPQRTMIFVFFFLHRSKVA